MSKAETCHLLQASSFKGGVVLEIVSPWDVVVLQRSTSFKQLIHIKGVSRRASDNSTQTGLDCGGCR